MGISIRAYARHRGVSHVAVKKAIDTGRITQLADGTIDPDIADHEWAQNTVTQRAAKPTNANSVTTSSKPQKTAPLIQPESSAAPLPSTNTSLLQARTANEVVKAQTNKVRLAQLKGELIDRSQALAHVFKLARAERDAWLNWPARVSSEMAAKLGVDSHELHVALEAAVREHLQDLGDVQAKVD
jgi:hypothetical protein